jgi:hypothetical protein
MSLVKPIKLDGTNIDLLLPSIDFFIEKIEKDEPFHFLRVNHGIIDKYAWGFTKLKPNSLPFEKLTEWIELKDYQSISNHLKRHNTWQYHLETKTLYDKVDSFVRVFHGYKDISDKFYIGVSAGVGLDGIWGNLSNDDPLQRGRTKCLKEIVDLSNHQYYHSGIFRHMSIMGENKKFIERLNEFGYEIVFMGPEYIRHFEDRLSVNNFTHISTPTRKAMDLYDDYINQVLEIRKKNKIILFHTSGHVASAYIAEKLKDTDIFGFDIGRSFDWIVKDMVDSEVTLAGDWFKTLNIDRMKEHIKRLRNG